MDKETITVHKYHKFNMHLIELLSLNSFHCSSREELNDPYDLMFIVTNEFIEDLFNGKHSLGLSLNNLLSNVYNAMGNHPAYINIIKGSIEEKINMICNDDNIRTVFTNTILNEYGYKAISFSGSKSSNQLLMWGHYAGYNGIRITFEFPSIFPDSPFGKHAITPVNYDNYIPYVSSENEIAAALLMKNKEWRYEDEYRIITKIADKLIFNKEYLKTITFGNKVSKNNMCMIVKLCKHFKFDCEFEILDPFPSFKYQTLDRLFVEAIYQGKFEKLSSYI